MTVNSLPNSPGCVLFPQPVQFRLPLQSLNWWQGPLPTWVLQPLLSLALTCSLPLSSSTILLQHHSHNRLPWALKWVPTGLLLSVSLSSRLSTVLLSFVQCTHHPLCKTHTSLEDPCVLCHSFYIHTTGLWCLPFCDLPSAFSSTWRAFPSLSGEFLVSLQNEGQGFTF